MIAQHHHELVAEIGDQALALIEIERDAFIIVIGEAVGELHRPLIERQQSILLRGDRNAGHRVGVEHADRVGTCRMNGAVNGEAGRIDAETDRIVDHLSVEIDSHEIRRRHLFKPQAVGVDQETMLRARQPGRDVGVDAVIKAEPVDQAVGGGEIDADLLDVVGVHGGEPCLGNSGHDLAFHLLTVPRVAWVERREQD